MKIIRNSKAPQSKKTFSILITADAIIPMHLITQATRNKDPGTRANQHMPLKVQQAKYQLKTKLNEP